MSERVSILHKLPNIVAGTYNAAQAVTSGKFNTVTTVDAGSVNCSALSLHFVLPGKKMKYVFLRVLWQ